MVKSGATPPKACRSRYSWGRQSPGNRRGPRQRWAVPRPFRRQPRWRRPRPGAPLRRMRWIPATPTSAIKSASAPGAGRHHGLASHRQIAGPRRHDQDLTLISGRSGRHGQPESAGQPILLGLGKALLQMRRLFFVDSGGQAILAFLNQVGGRRLRPGRLAFAKDDFRVAAAAMALEIDLGIAEIGDRVAAIASLGVTSTSPMCNFARMSRIARSFMFAGPSRIVAYFS